MTFIAPTSAAGHRARGLRLLAILFSVLNLVVAGAARGQDARGEPQQEDPKPEQPPRENGDQATDGEKVEEKLVYARMTTSKGDIIIELNRERAPITVENFLRYINEGFFDGTIFHRVIQNFVIQGGGFTKDMTKKSVYQGIENEWQNGLKNLRGTLSMARLGGRPNSASSQFFVNLRDNQSLDRQQADGAAYAVFGRVVAGMDVVDAIAGVPVERSSLNPSEMSQPATPVVIEKMQVIEADEAAKAVEAEKAAQSAAKAGEGAQPAGGEKDGGEDN